MSNPKDEATRQGDLLRDKGDFDGAIAAYTGGIRLNPQNAQAYSGWAKAYLRKGDLEKAIADCDKAIQLDPVMAEAFYTRGNCHV
jgi:tetratricopeptide (TPR) repeat protein